MNGHHRRVVVAGATGYIGRRLVAELVANGHHVRCLARTPDKLDAEPWRAEVEVVAGDVLDVESLTAAFREALSVGLVTPNPAELARPLIDSLVNEVVVHDHTIHDVVSREPIGCREAIELALRRIGEVDVSTRWTDAEMYGRTPADPMRMPTDPETRSASPSR